jgi:hypothetical protein
MLTFNKPFSMHFVIKPRILQFLFIIILVLITLSGIAQENSTHLTSLRRHFIIAYDIRSAADSNTQLNNLLFSLFTNSGLQGKTGIVCTDQFNSEIQDGKSFFNPVTDGISFFHYGVSRDDFAPIVHAIESSSNDSVQIDTTFINQFIKNTGYTWPMNNGSGSRDYESVQRLFKTFFNNKLGVDRFKNGYNNPELVLPFIITKMPKNSYASEYILIIVGLGTPPTWQNQLFTLPGNGALATQYIQNYQRLLTSRLKTVMLFSDSNISSLSGSKSVANATTLKAYKLLPSNSLVSDNGNEYSIESDINFSQGFLATTNFKISRTTLKNNLDANFSLTAVDLSILSNNGNENHSVFDTVFVKEISNKCESGLLMDSLISALDSRQIAYVPELVLSLPALYNERNFTNLLFQYSFYSQYEVANQIKLNYFCFAKQPVQKHSIQYASKFVRIFMFYILPVTFLLLIIFFLVFWGKPKSISLKTEGYLDSYENINYKKHGRFLIPYKFWNEKEDFIVVHGEIKYKNANYFFNWTPKIYLAIIDSLVIEGFEVFLKQDNETIHEFSSCNKMSLTMNKNNHLSFILGIRQNDVTQNIIEQQKIKVKIEGEIRSSFLFFETSNRTILEYKFLIGPDLGKVWVGFDPGTSGSCVAVGSSTDNIILIEDIRIRETNNPLRTIIPSVVGFDMEQDVKINGEIKDSQFIYGNLAYTRRLEERKYDLHYSLKKLLGFKDLKSVVFKNGSTLELQGKDLAKLLVRGLFRDMNIFFNRPEITDVDYKRDGKFSPLRAVVAIPNNCTISKIQDMIDCINNLDQFKEIRYVYEAEAVLFYYLSNSHQLNKGEQTPDKETILVFDMGGSTINATVVRTNKTLVNGRPKYIIDFLGKIGYGIGGDTIDYCISRFILGFQDEFPQFVGINIFQKKIQLAELAFQLKKEIISNYYSNKDYLITAYNLELLINKALGVTISINTETSEMYKYFQRESGKFKFFEHPLFVKTIYNNITDAVNEVVELSNKSNINKVIFSGRSTAFPIIKETVERQLKLNEDDARIIALNLEESKIAVAKGACWYGINKNAVQLNNLKTNSAFGFKKTLSANKTDVRFIELVEMGCIFDTTNDGIDSFEGSKNISDDFAFDGSKVNFYQIMGKHADKILAEGQKHKFSKVATIHLDQITSKIAMKVNENDGIECAVKLEGNRIIIEKGVVSDQEIGEANEEHYTWIVK